MRSLPRGHLTFAFIQSKNSCIHSIVCHERARTQSHYLRLTLRLPFSSCQSSSQSRLYCPYTTGDRGAYKDYCARPSDLSELEVSQRRFPRYLYLWNLLSHFCVKTIIFESRRNSFNRFEIHCSTKKIISIRNYKYKINNKIPQYH